VNFSKSALVLLLTVGTFGVPQIASAQIAVGVSIGIAPPALPVYEQPPCPVAGYLWTPGYWGYQHAGYFWVPGVWVAPPEPNVLWTPGYWGFGGGFYNWHPGYWGPHVGFYGGINYGFGYGGVGFFGGQWGGGVFRYNTAFANVNTTLIHNTYVNNTTIVNNTAAINHYSYNGPGGATGEPTAAERAFASEQHLPATSTQIDHQQAMSGDRGQFASDNHGVPATAAMDSVNGRRYDQQGRIANGAGSGQLTPGETRNLEDRESNLNGQIKADRSANGGSLTPQERQQVDNRQNNLSNSIYDDKHNDAVQHYGDNEAGQRRYNQQQRISNGIGSGEMTPAEAAKSEHREQNITQSIVGDRAANGGHLTSAERSNINRRQNGAGRQIYREKHNGARAPK
jgi:hypothetical protein